MTCSKVSLLPTVDVIYCMDNLKNKEQMLCIL